MSVVVCDDPTVLEKLKEVYDDGVVWLCLPALETAIGPLEFPNYIAHQIGKGETPGDAYGAGGKTSCF